MAYWCRNKQAQLKCLSNQFKRYYFQIRGPSSVNHAASHSRTWGLIKPNWFTRGSQFELRNNVRFFAAPVQAKPKQEEKVTSGPRLNEKITAEYVRLVTDEGHRVVSRFEALQHATRLNLDLVEVQRNAKPPVCKLMDYHKEKYKQQIKEKDRGKSKSELAIRKGDCKEVRFAVKIEQKDLQMKADMVKRLMERGYRVKCMAMGNEDQDLGGLLSRLAALIEDVAMVESGPRVEKKQAYVVVRHVKFGPSKKGSVKKASNVFDATSSNVQMNAVSQQSINTISSIQSEENFDAAESGLKSEDESSDENLEKNQPSWSVFDAGEEFNEVFDFGNDVNGVAKSSVHEQMKTAPEMLSSQANTYPEFMTPSSVLESTRTHGVSSSQLEASLRTENKYRGEPANRFSPTKSMDAKGTGARETTRSEPQFSSRSKQPRFNFNASSPTRETKQVESEASMFRNPKAPADEFPKQEPSRPSAPTSSAPSCGIFGAPISNDVSGRESVVTEVNRYRKGNNFDSKRNPGPVRVSPNSNTASSDGSGRPGVDKSGQGRWGIFGRESSNVSPSRSTENHAKIQR